MLALERRQRVAETLKTEKRVSVSELSRVLGVSEETVRRAVGELNLRLPVYKRIGTVTTRSDPFPRTASGKIKYS